MLGSMRQHHVPELLIEHLTKLQSMKVRRKIPSPRRSDRICVRRPSATTSAATPLDPSSVENWIEESLKVPFPINSPTDKRQPFSFRAKRRSSSKLLSLPISKIPPSKLQGAGFQTKRFPDTSFRLETGMLENTHFGETSFQIACCRLQNEACSQHLLANRNLKERCIISAILFFSKMTC